MIQINEEDCSDELCESTTPGSACMKSIDSDKEVCLCPYSRKLYANKCVRKHGKLGCNSIEIRNTM